MRIKQENIKCEQVIIGAAICLFGLFYEGISGIMSVVLVLMIILRLKEKNCVVIPKSLLLITIMLFPLCYLVVSIWALDWGE